MTQNSQNGQAPPPLDGELGVMLRDYMDVTQRLQRTHETLQGEVVRLRLELESKDRELERRQRLAALGELAAGVAHEVRNPLGAISLYSGLLRQQCGGAAELLRLIEKIEAGIRAIDGVVQDALAMAPRGGRLRRVNMHTVIENAHDVCLQILKKQRVEFATDYAADDVHVLGDEQALQRVLVNLIANAAEASQPEKTVTVTVADADGGFVEIRVLDQGSGLAPEILERVFDPFVTTKSRGTGLGLTIAHRLTEAHGGRLTARNRPEGGAEFRIVLPAAGEAAVKETVGGSAA